MSGDIHRLEGSNSQMQGGLIIKKKKTDNDDTNKFLEPKLPHMEKKSKLGLDTLAALKAKETKELVKFKERSHEDKKRAYRDTKVETPTYTGGVSYEAKKRRDERREKDRDRKYQASNNDRKKDRNSDNSHRNRRSDSQSRHRSHRGDYENSDRSERRRREKEWENVTPRSKRCHSYITQELL